MSNDPITRRGFVDASTGVMLGLTAISQLEGDAWGQSAGIGDVPLDKVTRRNFQPHLGEPFRLIGRDGRSIDTTLIEAAPVRVSNFPHGRREPFSLLFRGPARNTFAQDTYLVRHEKLGGYHLLLTPVGPQAGVYEAVIV